MTLLDCYPFEASRGSALPLHCATQSYKSGMQPSLMKFQEGERTLLWRHSILAPSSFAPWRFCVIKWPAPLPFLLHCCGGGWSSAWLTHMQLQDTVIKFGARVIVIEGKKLKYRYNPKVGDFIGRTNHFGVTVIPLPG